MSGFLAAEQHPVGCRIQATSHKMQYTSLQDAKDAKDAGYKDVKDTGCRIKQILRSLVAPLKRGRRIFSVSGPRFLNTLDLPRETNVFINLK